MTHWEGEPVAVWMDLWGVPAFEAHDELASTNDRLKEIAGQVAGPHTVVISESQRAGRGRRNAAWHSPAGSGLWMSVLLPELEPSGAYLPLMVGLATARAVDRVASGVEAGLEWPNDVIVKGKKVAGVLCEAVATGRGVVAGIGVNLRAPPGGFPHEIVARAGALEELAGVAVDRGALAGQILRELTLVRGVHGPREPCALDPDGIHTSIPPQLLADLNRRDVLRDRRVVTEQEGPGTARGIDKAGALVLERSDGSRVRVLAGSVRPK